MNQQPMSIEDPQTSLVEAMENPEFYPHQPHEVTHRETHISHVFLAGDRVYKVKKAVRFSFVDYTTLTKRHHFLHEEMRLNQRLAPSVYLDVVPITLDPFGWHLGGDGQPVEYALLMRRLPDKRMLPVLLQSGEATPQMMRDLTEVLAPFHAGAERDREVDVSRYPVALEEQWSENLADLRPFAASLIDNETLVVLDDFGTGFIRGHHELFIRRAAQGWIRDVHGDLHCEHVCFAPEGIQIFDCIEFSSKLRCCDIASEVAFLLMDLEFHGAVGLAGAFLERYLQLLQDPELPVLLPFYKCYRATVRGKVHALRSRGTSRVASGYFQLAERFTWEPYKPFLVMVCGLTGSGKSTLARELGERLGMPVISSDALRKALTGVTGSRRAGFQEDIYTPSMTEKTYFELTRQAEKSLRAHTGAILDATFSQQSHRERLIRLAKTCKVPLIIIYCRASDETTRNRLARRAAEGRDLSDGRWEIYLAQKEEFQPFKEIGGAYFLEIETDLSAEKLALTCERFIRSRLSCRSS